MNMNSVLATTIFSIWANSERPEQEPKQRIKPDDTWLRLCRQITHPEQNPSFSSKYLWTFKGKEAIKTGVTLVISIFRIFKTQEQLSWHNAFEERECKMSGGNPVTTWKCSRFSVNGHAFFLHRITRVRSVLAYHESLCLWAGGIQNVPVAVVRLYCLLDRNPEKSCQKVSTKNISGNI